MKIFLSSKVHWKSRVPENLRSLWTHYPLKANEGNDDQYVWDNVSALIEENLRLREESNWPKNLLFIGNDGAGNQHAIDLGNPDIPIGIEFEDIERKYDLCDIMEVNRRSVAAWFSSVIKEMKEDGYDETTGKTEEGGIWVALAVSITGFLFIIGIIFTVILADKFTERLFQKWFG